MENLKKFLIGIGIILGGIIVFSFLISLLKYFEIISNNLFKWLKLIIPIISFLGGGFYIGKYSANKGYLEGIKLGTIFAFLMLVFGILGFSNFKWTLILYYFILILSSMLGAMLGINRKKENG